MFEVQLRQDIMRDENREKDAAELARRMKCGRKSTNFPKIIHKTARISVCTTKAVESHEEELPSFLVPDPDPQGKPAAYRNGAGHMKG